MRIVAGCNGAGKTTFMRDVPRSGSVGWINPDETTDALMTLYPDFGPKFGGDRSHPNLAAATVSEARADSMIDRGVDFVVETVLASNKYLERARRARRQGMRVELIYVTLETPDLAVARVRTRVLGGGHDVDPAKVRKRWAASQHMLMEFIPHLDELVIFDNTNSHAAQPIHPFASLTGSTLTAHATGGLPYLRRVVRNAMMTGVAGFTGIR